MWFSFWKSRDRFSLEELRYLTDQLLKIQIVNEINKDFVIEALRSIAELITYGDQHDASFFEFFMEKQVMKEFLRILKISRTSTVSLQLLQTMSIIIQNLKSEHAIYYLFSTEHMNNLITYTFDFRNDELLSYYISFLRAISGKLNENTISLLVKTQNDEVVSFPMYVEAIKFAFHEENMVRTAVRALTLNVYHVGDDCVNRYITSPPHADYFSNLVTFFRRQCINLNELVSETMSPELSTSTIMSAVDEIEDNLYYISDVISAGIPDVGRLITDNIVQHLIFPLLLPSLRVEAVNGIEIGDVTSLYLLCCILRIVKIKDLANTIAAAFFCPLDAFSPHSEDRLNGNMTHYGYENGSQPSSDSVVRKPDAESLRKKVSDSSALKHNLGDGIMKSDCGGSHLALRVTLLSYITIGDDVQVSGALSILATLLQTKELDESMLDALGILPQRKQHKKLLLEALVGEDSGEEQLFSSENTSVKGGDIELEGYLHKLKDYGFLYSFPKVGASARIHRFQVLDALVSLFCRSNISAEILWDGGWLLRQLLPYSEAEFNSHHLRLLKNSYKNCATELLQEARGIWPDLLITVLCDEWKKCKRAIEAPSPRKEPKCMLLHPSNASVEDVPPESSFAAGRRMSELVKVFVLLHQLQSFSLGKALLEQPPIVPPAEISEASRAKAAGLDVSGPKPGVELRLVDAVPCRIAFERGKERHFYFLGASIGTSGWIILAEELSSKLHYGIIRVAAPLAGSNPRVDEKHSRWLHLRIRPSTLPFLDPTKHVTALKSKTKPFVDGRWILAFRDEDACKSALSMLLEEINLQSEEMERRLKHLVDLERALDSSDDPSSCATKTLTSNTTHNLL